MKEEFELEEWSLPRLKSNGKISLLTTMNEPRLMIETINSDGHKAVLLACM